ncbi:MAG TPA: phospholipid carrier-dependent glycosyltransferase [Ktedonobacteraceae bacterium]|nr:phospholipid carrier-dependent glycosyltransferase [Ktedonobacteraceae bacterium]
MTISRNSIPEPQDEDRRGQFIAPNADLSAPPGQNPGNPTGSPMRLPQSVRPGSVPQTPPWNLGGQVPAPGAQGGAINAAPVTPLSPSQPGTPAPLASGYNPQSNHPGPQLPPPPGNAPATNGPAPQAWSPNGPGGSARQARQPAMVGAVSGPSHTPLPNPPSGAGLQTQAASIPAVQPQPGIPNGNIIIYRAPNFIVRTVNRTGQKVHPLRKPTGYTAITPKVMPQQEQQVAVSETRMMPNVTLENKPQKSSTPLPAWLEAIIVFVALAATSVAHAYNMFNFPRYELDEGTYISNAWAITQGALSPYPYGYGHPPVGWIQIAGWIQLTGGFFTFGNALNSGRVLMLLYAVASALLVYLIVRRMTGSRVAGVLALVIFSFSPLSITYQRQIFLDNIATFWMLLSIYFLVISRSRLLYIVLAGIAFGLCFLSKEVFLIALPGMIYAAWLYTTKFQRKFSLVSFIYAIIALCSTFVLLAVLKNELFPYAWHLPWDNQPHLSILDTLIGQAERSQEGGSFIASWITWLDNDPFFIAISIAIPAFNLIYGWWNRKHLMLALLSICFWLLLIRGGQVLSFYIIPLIATTAINTGVALNTLLGWVGKVVRFDPVRVVLLLIVLAVVLPYDLQETGFRFYQHPTSAQDEAMVWVRDHVPHNSFIVVNSYLYMDLRVPQGTGVGDGAPFPHAEVYWNVAYDPELQVQALEKNWDRIDYIVADSEMLSDIQNYGAQPGSGMDLILTALKHSVLRADFRSDDHNLQIVVQVYQVIHKNPQPVVDSGVNPATLPGITSPPPGGSEVWAEQRKLT